MSADIFSKFRKVYNLLEDTISKDIFAKKVMFYCSSDYNYIFDIVNKYTECIDPYFSWKDYIEELKKLSEEKQVVIYGAGGEGYGLQAILKANNIAADIFADRNYEMMQNNVISPEELIKRYHKSNDVVITIGTEIYFNEIKKYLLENGVDEKDICGSAAHLEMQYFDNEIIKYVPNEVFVDCGCLNLSTSEQFIKNCSTNIEKIFAFEPDAHNYENCRNRSEQINQEIEVLPYGVYSDDKRISFLNVAGGTSRICDNSEDVIDVRKLDTILLNENVTFIKMDIEGAELDALKGAKAIIQKNKPKLAISIYHKPEDIIEIPLLLHEILPEYKFYIRHYSIYSVETVLYAII